MHTLEPRLRYTWIPFRDQDDLPLFDTALPDLNLVQLFRTNRYVGADRLGDANELAAGLTTRLLDADNGQQYLTRDDRPALLFREPARSCCRAKSRSRAAHRTWSARSS